MLQRVFASFVLVLIVLGSAAQLYAVDAVEKPLRPNIVYILLDDAGYGDLSCYGQSHFQTPNIDRLSREGMKFTQHYAGCTVCAPTRCVLMTGRHTGHCYVRGNKEVKPEGQEPIPSKTVTLPELLKQAGYATGGFGKWGLGSPGSEGDPVNQGFDEFFGYNCQREAHTYYPTHLWHNTEKVKLDGKNYSHDLIMNQSLDFVRDHQDQPFFCFLPVTIPHAAMHVPDSYSDPFRKKFSQFNGKIGRYRGPVVDNPVAAFAGMMTKLDEDVGRLLDLLAELEIDKNTIVMLTSDNGPHVEGGHNPKFFDSNGPLRGFKRDLYEGGIRAPFLVRWPGRVPENTTSDLLSAHWDILPTCCELAGVDAPKGTDGISLVPTLLGNDSEQAPHKYLYWEFHERGGKRAVRFGNWKAVQLDMNQKQSSPIELYDLSKDIDESDDIAASHPDVVRQAEVMFEQAHTPSNLWPFPFDKE